MWQRNKDVEKEKEVVLTNDENAKSNFRVLDGFFPFKFDLVAISSDELIVSNLDELVLETIDLLLVFREERYRHHLRGSIGLIHIVRM